MRPITTLFLLLLPYLGYCDFVDYWVVQLNDSTIYDSREDKESWNRVHTLNLSELGLTNSDTIRVVYRPDSSCQDCEYNLLLISEAWAKKTKYQMIGSAIFELTMKDFDFLNERTQLIYFQTGKPYLRRILIIE